MTELRNSRKHRCSCDGAAARLQDNRPIHTHTRTKCVTAIVVPLCHCSALFLCVVLLVEIVVKSAANLIEFK